MVPRAPGPLRPATGCQRCACAGGADRLAPRFGGGSLMGLLARSHFGIQFSLGFQKSGRVFWRAFGGCCFSLTGLGGCGGCSCRGGMGTGCLLPCRAVLPWPGSSSIHGWRWYFPMAHLALAPARAPRAGRELLPHGISRGASTASTGGRGTRAAASVPHPGEALPSPSRSPPFQPCRLLLFMPETRPGTGGSALPRPPSGPPLRGRACGRQRRRKVKTKQTKIHPQPWGAQLQQRRLFPGQGETRVMRQNSDLAFRRAPLPSPSGGARGRGAEPGGAGGGRRAEPGGVLRPAEVSPP